MKKRIILSFTAICLLFTAATLAQEPIKINTQESKIIWKGKKPTGEHTGYIKLSQGELLVENNNVKGGSFIIDMKSIINVDITDKESNQKLVNHLKSKDFFDVATFPTAKFIITNISAISNNGVSEKKATHRIDGDLTIKSITKKVSFDASINKLNGKFAASTPDFTINRTEWDVNYQSKSMVAGLKDQFIYDEITLSIELVSR